MGIRLRGLGAAMGAFLLLFALPVSAGSIYTDQATASAALTIYADHNVASGVAAIVPAGTKLTLEAGPYGPANDWWCGKVNGTATVGWFKAQQIKRVAKAIPDGNRWVDVTIDDTNKLYIVRLLVGTTIVDQMNCAPGKPTTPTPAAVYKTSYRDPKLFELKDSPGVFLQWWQTFRWDGGDTLAWALHSWVLDGQGFPTSMGQYGRISHGCVRQPRAMDTFAFLPPGSTVNIHYSPWRGATTSTVMAVKGSSSNINVRSTNSTSGAILGQIQGGQVYVSDAQSQGWFRIRFDSRNGWVWGGFAPRVKATTTRVTYSDVNVRTGAGTGYSILGKAYSGYRYGYAGYSGSWTKVWYRGRTAWIISASVVRVAL